MSEESLGVLGEMCMAASSPEEMRSVSGVLNDLILWSRDDQYASQVLTEVIQPALRKTERRVLFFHLYGWLYGGAERAITSVANHLSHKYRVVVSVFEPVENASFHLGPEVALVPLYGNRDRVDRLVSLVRLISPDVFVGNNNSIPEFVGIYRDLRSLGIKSVAYNHEYYFYPHNHKELYPSVVERNRALAHASAACFLTTFSANAYALVNRNAAIMPNPNTFPVQNSHFNPGRKTILAVGRFSDPIKRVDRLLDAFYLVSEAHPDAKLVVVGPYNLDARVPFDSPETVGDILRRRHLDEDRVTFVGQQEEVSSYYEEADAFVLTSENEGFGMVLTEAGSFGLPSVLFSVPGLDDIIVDGVNGFIVPQGDVGAMAERLSKILGDVDLRRRMSEAARHLVGRFAIERVGARWEELISLILTSNNAKTIEEGLSLKFMTSVSDYGTFLRLVAGELESTAIKCARWGGDRGVVPYTSVKAAAEKLSFNLRNHGLKATARKAGRTLLGMTRERLITGKWW